MGRENRGPYAAWRIGQSLGPARNSPIGPLFFEARPMVAASSLVGRRPQPQPGDRTRHGRRLQEQRKKSYADPVGVTFARSGSPVVVAWLPPDRTGRRPHAGPSGRGRAARRRRALEQVKESYSDPAARLLRAFSLVAGRPVRRGAGRAPRCGLVPVRSAGGLRTLRRWGECRAVGT